MIILPRKTKVREILDSNGNVVTKKVIELEDDKFNDFMNYVKELQKKNKALKSSKVQNFIEYQQTLGLIFSEIEKSGINCENCKYCQTVIKDGKEEKMCVYYKQFFNLEIEKPMGLCENFKSKKGGEKECI